MNDGPRDRLLQPFIPAIPELRGMERWLRQSLYSRQLLWEEALQYPYGTLWHTCCIAMHSKFTRS